MNSKPLLITIAIIVVLGLLLLSFGGSGGSRNTVNSGGSILEESQEATSAVLVDSITRSLNNLPSEVVTELMPPKNVLDDTKSADGKEVLGVLGVTPGVPDSPFNYLSIPEGNGNFRTARVQPGDIVRYFVKYNQEDLEHGFENITYLELPVRRLDVNNPQNALIVEVGLNGPVEYPHRVEVWRFSDRRMLEIRTRLNRYLEKPRDLIGWEPSPDESGLVQLLDRLNQWWRNLPKEPDAWEAPDLVGSLPSELTSEPPLSALLDKETLAAGGFENWEARLLQQAVWLRDISTWAKHDALSELDVARELFDWTIRNIRLDAPDDYDIIHHPWQALMYGHGSAADRAWVFAELCRHQQLDVAMIGLRQEEGSVEWWLPALVSEGELHLFDTELGLPIPGTGADGVATLADVLANPAMLDELSVAGADAYSVTSESLTDKDVVVGLIASPLQLSRRAAELQNVLESENFVTVSADLPDQTAKVDALEAIDSTVLWPHPFRSIVDEQNASREVRLRAAQRFLVFAQRPKLWEARVLHFQGTKDVPLAERNDPLAQADFGHRRATGLYQDRTIRPSARVLSKLDPTKQAIYGMSKLDAGYWLGLLKFDEGRPEVAKHWLEVQTLEAVPNGPWTDGARYNAARCYEALGELEKAIELLETGDSPQQHGNLLRAKMLRAQLPDADSADEGADDVEEAE